MALQVIDGLSFTGIRTFSEAKLSAGADIFSDGLACFVVVIEYGYSFTVFLTRVGRNAEKKG